MAMPDEHSVFCDFCSAYNIQCSSIIEIEDGLVCESCVKRFGGNNLLNQLKSKLKNEIQKENKKNEST